MLLKERERAAPAGVVLHGGANSHGGHVPVSTIPSTSRHGNVRVDRRSARASSCSRTGAEGSTWAPSSGFSHRSAEIDTAAQEFLHRADDQNNNPTQSKVNRAPCVLWRGAACVRSTVPKVQRVQAGAAAGQPFTYTTGKENHSKKGLLRPFSRYRRWGQGSNQRTGRCSSRH